MTDQPARVFTYVCSSCRRILNNGHAGDPNSVGGHAAATFHGHAYYYAWTTADVVGTYLPENMELPC